MPRYKSLLGSKKTNSKTGGSKTGGSKSGGSKSGGSKSGGSKSAGVVSAGAVSGGYITAGGLEFDKIDGVMEKVKQNPKMMLHLLEMMGPKAIIMLKEIAKQRVGPKSGHHPQYVEQYDKKHELFAPNKDIAHNARDVNHLMEALQSELKSKPSGGGLFSSIWHGVKDAGKWVNRNIIKKIPKISDVQKLAKKVLSIARPIINGIDEIGPMVGMPVNLSPYLDKASDFIDSDLVNKASDLQGKIVSGMDQAFPEGPTQQKIVDNPQAN